MAKLPALLRAFEQSPQAYVRLGGVLYLGIIVLGIFGELFVRGALVVPGDALATANNISAAQFLWRCGIVGDLLMHIFDVPVIVIFYLLLRPINENLALWVSWINIVQTSVLALNKLNLVLPILLLSDASYLGAFALEQRHALALLAIKAHGFGFSIGLIFFGVACVVKGYVMLYANYFPKVLGVLFVLAGLSYLINSIALLLAPGFAALLFPWILLPAFVGELTVSLWLIIKGVNLSQWRHALDHAPTPLALN